MLAPGQRVHAPYPLTVYGRVVHAGQCGVIIRKYPAMDGTWFYDVLWDWSHIIQPVREDEIEDDSR